MLLVMLHIAALLVLDGINLGIDDEYEGVSLTVAAKTVGCIEWLVSIDAQHISTDLDENLGWPAAFWAVLH